LLDAGYGNHTSLRGALNALELTYVAGILSNTSVWAPGAKPLAPKRWSGRGRPPTRLRHGKHKPVCVKELAFALPTRAWRTVGWREGASEKLSSRFARVRVRAAHRGERHDEEWLLIEWPKSEKEPTKYWLSTLPQDIGFERMVDQAKLRWRIERDYQELKQELGLGHFEGRGWRGFHHHATLCIAAYGFLISERETIPPSAPRAAARLAQLALPTNYRPRGAANPDRTAHPKLDRDHATALDLRSRPKRSAMPLLRPTKRPKQTPQLVTQ
jgi:SRSO17 transposase